jgi:hypothetical protein
MRREDDPDWYENQAELDREYRQTVIGDPEQLDNTEDAYLRQQLGEPYEWPADREVPNPRPGQPLGRPTERTTDEQPSQDR